MRKIFALLFVGFAFLPFSASAQTLSGYFGGAHLSARSLAPRALECGIENFKATKSQSIALLKCLKAEDAKIHVPNVLPGHSKKGLLGAYNPVTGYQSRTTAYISATATTIPVSATKDKAGNQITLSNISASSTVNVYMSLEPGTSKEEPILCTGVTATSWTGCTRGLAFNSGSETGSTTIAMAHNAGAAIMITNIGQFFNQFVDIDSNQQINGLKTFANTQLLFGTSVSSSPKIYFHVNPTTSTDPFVFWNGTKMGWSDDGVNTQTFSAGSSGLSAGKGITFNSSVVQFNPAATSTGALGFYGGTAIVTTSTNGGIQILSDGLALNTSTPVAWNASTSFFSTVTTTHSGPVIASQFGSSGSVTTTITGPIQINGNLSYNGTKQGSTSLCVGSGNFTGNATTTVTCGWQPSSVILNGVLITNGDNPSTLVGGGATDCTTNAAGDTNQSYYESDWTSAGNGTTNNGSGRFYKVQYNSGGASTHTGYIACSATGFAIGDLSVGGTTKFSYVYQAFR